MTHFLKKPTNAAEAREAALEAERKDRTRLLRAADLLGVKLSRRQMLKASALAATGMLLGAGTGCADVEAALSNASGIPMDRRVIVDHAGRELELPAVENLQRVMSTSGLAQFFLATTGWDLMGAVSGSYDAAALEYLPDELGQLINLGSITEGTMNAEGLLLEDIQIVFSISAVDLTQQNIDDANALQQRTGIPVVLVDGSMDRITDAYRLLGECLGREERASQLRAYCTDVYDRVTAAMEGLKEEDKKTFYYAEGPNGLYTEPRGNQHSVMLDHCGGLNVIVQPDLIEFGMIEVSLEEVLSGDPEIIFASCFETSGGADYAVRNTRAWKPIRAVKDERVYTIPDVPYSWVDRPGAANRFLGMQWAANLMYPERFPADMIAVAQEFYELFYETPLDTAVARQMLAGSTLAA